MPNHKFCTLHYSAILFLLALPLAGVIVPAQAHSTDGGPPLSAAPAATEPIETLTGAIEQLVVENRVTGVTVRYVAIRLDDGNVAALKGEGLEALAKGARVEAKGRVAGDTLFVTGARVLSAAQQSVVKAPATKQVQGTLALAHADNFDGGKSSYMFVVRGTDGHDTLLKLAVIPDTLRSGMNVVATGSSAADGFSLDTDNVVVLTLPVQNGPIANATNNNVLVVLIKFTDSPASDPFTPAAVDQAFRTNSNSTANYYNEVSYGQQLLNVTVTPTWLTAAVATPPGCDFTAMGNAADTAAAAAGYTGNYDFTFYVMPRIGACGWAGLAYVGFPHLAWSNGYNQLSVYAHELGHNFGLLHAASLYCAGQIVGGPCSATEYGDPYSVMGNLGTMHFDSAQKWTLGWITQGAVQTHNSGTTNYTLWQLEQPLVSTPTYAVKIPASSTRTYWVEYRKAVGFDSGVSGVGAQIRVAQTNYAFEQGCGGCDDTEILDMTPGTPNSFGDAALPVGQSFVDRATGVTINAVASDASGLHVTVSKVNVPMLGDFDNDGSSDILWQSPSTGQGAFWFMKLGALDSSSTFSLPAGWLPQGVGDFNGDGKADIVWTNPGLNLTAIWFMNGSSISSAQFFGVPNTWSIAGIGDFNGDGRADILWRNVNGQIAAWMMNGSTIQSVVYYNNVDASWTVLGTGDFFGDGKSEVVWSHQPDGTIYLWRNADQSAPQLISLGRPGGSWQVVAIGDFNGDGKADLFFRDVVGTNAIWPAGIAASAVFPPGVPTTWSVMGAKQLYAEGRSNVLWRSDTGIVAQWRFDTNLNPTGTFLTGVPLNWLPVGR